MGKWNINIQGTGPHHNNKDYDVDVMVNEFLNKLVENGHTVVSSYLTVGSASTMNTGKFTVKIGDN